MQIVIVKDAAMESDSHLSNDKEETAGGSAPFEFKLSTDGNGIDIAGWTIRSVEKAIANTTAEEQLSKELKIKLPSMLFDQSRLSLSYTPSRKTANREQFGLNFDAVSALRLVGEADPKIKVKAAAQWASNKRRKDVEVRTINQASDWTFSTKYGGHLVMDTETSRIENSDKGQTDLKVIDYEALRDTKLPILFSSQVVLYEDELDDNGTASYKVRIRVMPEFFFILARFFLRVDGVLIRIYDTRYFHHFGSPVIVREVLHREANLATNLGHVHISELRDADKIAPQVPITFTTLDNIFISPRDI